jgi:hypothetical protein
MDFLNFLAKQWTDWTANPLPSVLAIIAGGLIGYRFCRVLNRAKAEGMEQRLKHLEERMKAKDEQIEQQDKAITKASEEAKTLKAAILPATAQKDASAPAMPSSAQTARFFAANERIVRETTEKIYRAVATTRYKFVYNPHAQLHL